MAVVTLCLLLAVPRLAAAQDLLLVPYLGFTFAGGSSLLDLESGSSESASVLGASGTLLGQGLFGVEADVGWAPGFFERGDRQLVASSSVTNLTGAVMLTLPVSVTRESLRPYVLAGGGLLRAEARDNIATFTIRRTMPAMVLGGGAIGFLTNSVGVRFDLRHLRSLGEGDDLIVGEGPRVRYWRGSVGLVLRY
jgi:hypothetical protein